MTGVTLDHETVDRITVLGLKDYLDSCEQSLKSYHNGGWLHPDDVAHTNEMIKALKFVLRDFTAEHEWADHAGDM